MELELENLTDESLQRINQKLTSLVELKNGQTDFNDLEDAEKSALAYVERRKQGYRTLENPEDDDIRNEIRDFLKKRSSYQQKETRDLSITKPNY
jgi:alpha-glucuronidase